MTKSMAMGAPARAAARRAALLFLTLAPALVSTARAQQSSGAAAPSASPAAAAGAGGEKINVTSARTPLEGLQLLPEVNAGAAHASVHICVCVHARARVQLAAGARLACSASTPPTPDLPLPFHPLSSPLLPRCSNRRCLSNATPAVGADGAREGRPQRSRGGAPAAPGQRLCAQQRGAPPLVALLAANSGQAGGLGGGAVLGCCCDAPARETRRCDPTPHSPPPTQKTTHKTKKAVSALIGRVGKNAGVALSNKTFVGAEFSFMMVPGRAWTAAELRAAAPLSLKTRCGAAAAVAGCVEGGGRGGGGGACVVGWLACCSGRCFCLARGLLSQTPSLTLPGAMPLRPSLKLHTKHTNSGGELLNVTRDLDSPEGIRVDGARVVAANRFTADRAASLFVLDAVPVAPSQRATLDRWLSTARGGAAAAADASPAGVPGAAAPAAGGSGGGAPAAAAASGAGAAGAWWAAAALAVAAGAALA